MRNKMAAARALSLTAEAFGAAIPRRQGRYLTSLRKGVGSCVFRIDGRLNLTGEVKAWQFR